MRYTLITHTVPKDRTERSVLSTETADDPRLAQKIYDASIEKGFKIEVINNYLKMDETIIFERGFWRV